MQFYQQARLCFVTSRKKMQSSLICSLDCDANNIFVWMGRQYGDNCPLPTGEGQGKTSGDDNSSAPYSPYTDNDGIPQTGGEWSGLSKRPLATCC